MCFSSASVVIFCGFFIWCPEVESNHRHENFQPSDLPAELSSHYLFHCTVATAMSQEAIFIDTVRSCCAGHTFYERWGARHALQLVFSKDDFFAML